jgi:putative thioredoxin
MVEISRKNLETDLIEASLHGPVLLDIWAPWCGPCKALSPALERLEQSYAGRFTLAKLNSDDEPEIAGQLSQMFGVRSIPFCVLFKGGQPVDGFVGALPEGEVRAFLDKHVPSAEEVAANDEVEEAAHLLDEGDTDAAIEKLQATLAANPANDAARVDCLHALLGAGRVADARLIYAPVAHNPVLDAGLLACGHWIAACERAVDLATVADLEAKLVVDKRDFKTRFELAQVHFAAYRFTQAMDALLEIIIRDKTWNQELARKTYVSILGLMSKGRPTVENRTAPTGAIEVTGTRTARAADPIVDSYRRKLSMALF